MDNYPNHVTTVQFRVTQILIKMDFGRVDYKRRTNHQRKCKNDQNSRGSRQEEKEDEIVAVVPNRKTTDVTLENASDNLNPSFSWGIHNDSYVEILSLKSLTKQYSQGKHILIKTYLLNEWLHDSPLSNISIKMVIRKISTFLASFQTKYLP